MKSVFDASDESKIESLSDMTMEMTFKTSFNIVSKIYFTETFS